VDKLTQNDSVKVTQAKNQKQGKISNIKGKRKNKMVAGVGFEPTTSGL